MTSEGKHSWAAKWQAECERATFNAALLLRLADRRPTCSAVVKVLCSAPRSPDELVQCDETPCLRCANAAERRSRWWQRDQMNAAFDYFIALAAMPPARRMMLEASLTGVLIGYSTGGRRLEEPGTESVTGELETGRVMP